MSKCSPDRGLFLKRPIATTVGLTAGSPGPETRVTYYPAQNKLNNEVHSTSIFRNKILCTWEESIYQSIQWKAKSQMCHSRKLNLQKLVTHQSSERLE